MNRAKVMDELISIVEDIKKVKYDGASVSEESFLGGDLGIHSVEMLEVMFDLQRYFKIKIGDQDLANLYTVKDVLNLLERYLTEGKA